MDDLIFFSSLVITPLLALGIHELGHLLSGLYLGFKLEMFVLGFLGIKRENNRIKFFLNTNFQYFGGLAATTPTKILTENELIDKYKVIILSGPLVSFVTGILSLILYFLIDHDINLFWGLLGVMSLGVFLATTVPNKSGIFFTDRKRFQRLINKGEIGRIEAATLQITNQLVVEDSFKNLPLDKIKIIQTDPDKFTQFWGLYCEYEYYKANDFFEQMENAKAILINSSHLIPRWLWKSFEIN